MHLPFELEPSWLDILKEEMQELYVASLTAFLERERASGANIYPPKDLVFNAFWKTPFDKVNVLIMGQDPYHGIGQAHGLSFSVPRGIQSPPSLQNIFKELAQDVKTPPPAHGCLNEWAEQGVMLLNALLTVRQGEPLSHQKKGWEKFTDAVIKKLSDRQDPLIFVLWGKTAQEKCSHVKSHHHILKAPHPSPLSAHQGFLGCGHFSKINEILINQGKAPIDWNIK